MYIYKNYIYIYVYIYTHTYIHICISPAVGSITAVITLWQLLSLPLLLCSLQSLHVASYFVLLLSLRMRSCVLLRQPYIYMATVLAANKLARNSNLGL